MFSHPPLRTEPTTFTGSQAAALVYYFETEVCQVIRLPRLGINLRPLENTCLHYIQLSTSFLKYFWLLEVSLTFFIQYLTMFYAGLWPESSAQPATGSSCLQLLSCSWQGQSPGLEQVISLQAPAWA